MDEYVKGLQENILDAIIILIGVLCVMFSLNSCSIFNNLDGSYTRLYPITSYELGSERFKATYTLEDDSEGYINAEISHLYFHEGEDTLIVISSDKDGTDFDGVKEFYLYLNSEKAKEYIGTMIDSKVENGG